MYKTEAAFKRKMVSEIRKYRCVVNNIESHNNIGIPDLYVMMPRVTDLWIELKNDKDHSLEFVRRRGEYHVQYRPGQLGWRKDYSLSQGYMKNVLTVVALQDGYVYTVSNFAGITKNECVFSDHLLSPGVMRLIAVLHDLSENKHETNRELLVDLVEYMFGYDYDFDSDVLWNELQDTGSLSINYSIDGVSDAYSQLDFQRALVQYMLDSKA